MPTTCFERCHGTDARRSADGELVCVAHETAAVRRVDAVIAKLSHGTFIGDMTCLTGAPATAAVVAEEPLHCLRIPSEEFRRHLQARPVTLEHLEREFGADPRATLALWQPG